MPLGAVFGDRKTLDVEVGWDVAKHGVFSCGGGFEPNVIDIVVIVPKAKESKERGGRSCCEEKKKNETLNEIMYNFTSEACLSIISCNRSSSVSKYWCRDASTLV